MARRELDLEADAAIDRARLDEELIRLPSLLARYGEANAKANTRLKEAEENEKYIRSVIAMEIQAGRHESKLGPKPTVATIEAFYRTDPRHVEAKEEIVAATGQAEAARMAYMAISAKRTVLPELTRMERIEYWASESVMPNDARERAEEYGRKLEGEAVDRMNADRAARKRSERTKRK